MARFGIEQTDNYGGQGGGGYFSLKNDKDVAEVRILYDSVEDIEGYSVHKVEIDGKNRYVNCPREYNSPIDDCPLCKSGNYTQVKFFVPIYDIKDKKVKTWEKGKKFSKKLSSLCSRYPHLYTHTFEIERNGVANDQQTTYEIYETGQDKDIDLESFELPTIVGGMVLNKNYEEMEHFVKYGNFPADGAATTRRDADDSRAERRTPPTDEPVRRRVREDF